MWCGLAPRAELLHVPMLPDSDLWPLCRHLAALPRTGREADSAQA